MNAHQRRWLDLQPGVTWPGDVDDFARLLCSVGAHCTCRQTPYVGRGARSCPAHQLLAEQHVLDHLVYGRRMRARFMRSEWSVETPESDAVYMRLLRRLTQRGNARTFSEIIRWRPGVLTYALAGLVLLASVGTVVHPSQPPNSTPIASWQSR